MRSGIEEVMVGKDFEVGGKESVCEYVVMVVKSRREKESGNGKKTWLIQEEMRIQSQFLTRIKGQHSFRPRVGSQPESSARVSPFPFHDTRANTSWFTHTAWIQNTEL